MTPQEVQKMITNTINGTSNASQFGVSKVGYHTHNGIDSPRLTSATQSGVGTVSSVSVTTANGISGSVTNPTTTPAISLTLGAITPTTVNGATLISNGTSTEYLDGTGNYSTPSGSSSSTNALNSATTVVNVSSSTAPTSGQVLTATSGTAATWQTPSVTATQTTSTFLAGESISAGNPVSVYGYASGGLINLDQLTQGTSTATNVGILTFSVNVTSGSAFLTIFVGHATGAMTTFSTVNATAGGVSMNKGNYAFSSSSPTNEVFSLYLANPPTGSVTVVINAVLNNGVYGWASYSHFSVQGLDQGSSTSTNSGLGVSLTFSPANEGEICLMASSGPSSQVIYGGYSQASQVSGAFQASDSGIIIPKGAGVKVFNTTTTASSSIVALTLVPTNSTSIAVVNSSSANPVYTYNKNRLNSFIGFSNGSVSANTNVGVVTAGVITGLSGIFPSSFYYLNDTNGTIGIVPGTNTRKVGIGTSTTSLVVNNNW